MPNVQRPQRDFCSQCGFPVRGSRCDACGSAQAPRRAGEDDDGPVAPRPVSAYASAADADVAGLERAAEALRARDLPRFVEQLLASETGVAPRATPTPEGPGWVVPVRGSLVFVTLRGDGLTLEAPIARIPPRRRLPALRLALELCAGDAASSRVCARGDLLLLRLEARLAAGDGRPSTPAVLRHHLREIGHLAARYAGLMTVSLDALPAFPETAGSPVTFEALEPPKKIHLSAIRRSIPPATGEPPKHAAENGAPPRPPSPPAAPPKARPVVPPTPPVPPRAAAPPAATPPVQPAAPAPPARPVQRPSPGEAEPIPAILSPMFSTVEASVHKTAAEQGGALTQAEIEERHRRGTTTQTGTIPSSDGLRRASATSLLEQSSDGRPRPSGRTEIEIDTFSRRPSGGSVAAFEAVKPSPSEPTISPADRLCMLLRHAQSLASLTLEERPATMAWLVRSAVFRAIYDFKDSLPDAVAHLYRCTGTSREPPSSSSRVSAQLQATEPALVVMERLIVARGQMAKEKPLAIEPMTSAAQAKEHVARYLGEIDRAPNDAGLRHFLALGALTELLVRTKLPPQTDQRLRDIVAHAQREGAKPAAIDLMMTALQRINS